MTSRLAVLSIIMLTCLVTCLPGMRLQAQIGPYGPPAHWEIKYVSSGTFTGNGSISGAVTLPVTDAGTSPSTIGFSPYSANGTTSASGDYTNTIAVTAKWVNQNGSIAANPPAKVYLCETSQVYSSAHWLDTNTGGNATGKTDNGRGDPEVDDPVYTYSGSSQGKHLIQLDVSQGIATYTVTQKANFNVKDGPSPSPSLPQGCNGSISFRFNVILDTRGVSMSREGAHGEVVFSDGTKGGDTLRSYTNLTQAPGSDITVTTQVKNWQQFDVSLIGGWHTRTEYTLGLIPHQVPDVTFQWSPAYSGATAIWNQWLQDPGQQGYMYLEWTGSTGSPQTDPMQYTVTDNQDGATASALYYLTRHDVYEKGVTNTAVVFDNDRPAGSGGIYNQGNTPIDVPGGYLEKGVSYSLGVAIQPDAAVGGWELSLIGMSVNYTYTVTWNAGQNAPTITVPPGMYTYLRVADTYTRHWGTATQWDAGGFTGNPPFDFKVPLAPGYMIYMGGPYQISNGNGGTGSSGGSGGG